MKKPKDIDEPKREAGRPPFFDTPEQMQAAIDAYLHSSGVKTITGLAYELGFESRQSFYDYEKKDGFTYTVKRARLYIEQEYEKGLSGTTPTGSIFALKNFGWSDKQEHEVTGKDGGPMQITVTIVNKPRES